MDELFKLLLSNAAATTTVLVIFGVAASTVIFIFLVAFLQGRDISFWPPKIGLRPNKPSAKLNVDLEESPHPVFSYRSRNRSDIPEADSLSSIPQFPQPITPESFLKPPIKNKPFSASGVIQSGLKSLVVLEIILTTDHSVIEKCSIEGKYYILKRTRKCLCDEQSLRDLVLHSPIGSIGRVSVASPVALWLTDDYIWELYPYYIGISLPKLIQRNKYQLQGEFLGSLHNSLFKVLEQLHRTDILHRDINPTNFLYVGNGNLVLLDATFSCKLTSKQIPIGNKQYTPPEQFLGLATVKSDWYSLAATLYYLANGEPPQVDSPELETGIGKIFMGAYRSHKYGAGKNILRAILKNDVSQRPPNSEGFTMDQVTVIQEFYPVLGILDLDPFGYLVEQTYDFHFFNRDELSGFLREAIKHNAIETLDLRNDIELFFKGKNSWIF